MCQGVYKGLHLLLAQLVKPHQNGKARQKVPSQRPFCMQSPQKTPIGETACPDKNTSDPIVRSRVLRLYSHNIHRQPHSFCPWGQRVWRRKMGVPLPGGFAGRVSSHCRLAQPAAPAAGPGSSQHSPECPAGWEGQMSQEKHGPLL